MPTNTYVALDKVTVGTAVSFATFSSIPATYTDLVIVANGNTSALVDTYLRFNGDSTSGLYSTTRLYGNGSTAASDRYANQNHILSGDFNTTSNTSTIFQIQNYSNASTFKTSLIRSNYAGSIVFANVGLWRNTAAITSVTISTSSGNFAVGSTFSLYGIASAEVGAKATGGVISSDASYWYHTFLANGTFTPTTTLSCDYLVVAGGGGGGGTVSSSPAGGGGGAGGFLTSIGGSALSLSATGYTVTIGAGGAGGTTSGTAGSVGSDSVFSSITSAGGGGGAGYGSNTPGIGGSGGGAAWKTSGTAPGGAASPSGQGNAGGAAQTAGNYQGGAGGGGAGAVGTSNTAANNNGTTGGAGLASSINGTSITYAGGGGGGGGTGTTPNGTGASGGSGGGGAGGNFDQNGVAGIANLGGGGGGSGYFKAGGAGGSGIVIVRYSK